MIVTSVLLLWLAQAPASEPPFDTLVQDSLRAYRNGAYLDAAEGFERAFGLRPEPRLMYNIARSYEKVPDVDRAIECFNRFLELPGTTSELRARATKALRALEAEKRAAAEPPTPAPPPVATPPPPAPPPPSVQARPPPELGPPPAPPSRALEWSLLGGGAAAAATGAVFAFLVTREEDRFREATTLDAQQRVEDRGRRYALAADVLMGLGGASLVTGAILFLARDGGSGPRVVPSVAADRATLSWYGAF